MIDEQAIISASKAHDCFYLYDEAGIRAQCRALRLAFSEGELLYSVKANPNPQLLKTIFSERIGADAASVGEVRLARRLGLLPEQIYFSAPGKTAQDIAATIDEAHLIADSLDEIVRIETVAAERNRSVKIGLRINPAFSFSGETGVPSKFGIDEAQALSFLRSFHSPFVTISGLHVHLRSQVLCAPALAQYHRHVLALAERFLAGTGRKIDYVNLGSGIGVPYAENDQPVDLAALGAQTCEAIGAFRRAHPDVRFLLETGRYLVGPNGVYVTTVLDRKVSHGKTFLILKNTLNGFLRPSLACLLARAAGSKASFAAEPLYTGPGSFRFSTPGNCAPAETVTLAGNLCTTADVIAEDIRLPRLSCGDLIAISNAGAYAAALSPMQFSGQEKPAELLVRADGSLLDITER